jgi:hypothetical protein
MQSLANKGGWEMEIRRVIIGLSASLVIMMTSLHQWASADDSTPPHHATAAAQRQGADREPTGELIRAVRDSTRRFRNVEQAKAEGYLLMFGCVSGPDDGAMGLHYVNLELVGDPALDPSRPEIVIYEPLPNGGRRLIGADFLVFAESWHASNTATPQIMGQLMHLFESPNRFGLPAFYTLHVWAWKPNPTGAFVNWHNDVSCEQFDGKEQ